MNGPTLADRLRALPALEMRVAALRDTLTALAAAQAAALCSHLLRSGEVEALIPLAELIESGALGYDFQADLYAEATAAGDIPLAQLFLSPQPVPPGRPSVPLELADKTLGERKSLARRQGREIIERMMRDPTPQVVAILLENPRLTEVDVVRIAARRPTLADTQRVILRSERFICREEVRRALALNPYTPTDVTFKVLATLKRRDLEEVARDGQLLESIRISARALLER